jgi:DNA-binding CsgD family transcriptional regulator
MGDFNEGQVAGLIESFYEAAVRPELWRGLLGQLSEALGAEGCYLIPGVGSSFQPMCSDSMMESCITGLKEGWFDRNPRFTRGFAAVKSTQEVVTESMLFSRWELDHLPFHAEFVSRFRARWFAGLDLAGQGATGLALTAERLARQEPFSSSEIETLSRLVPHIQGAGRMALHLAAARDEGLLDGFTHFDCGALLLDWMGRVLRVNAKGESLLGPWLTIRNRRLSAGGRDCDASLQKLIGAALNPRPLHEGEPLSPIAIARPGGGPLIVQAAPVARSAADFFQQAKAVLMIVDPGAPRTPGEPLLRQVFGLTGAEAAIAMALARGDDLDTIAGMRKVSLGTLRHQVKSIFAKTETGRQAELVALLGRYAPVAR